MNQTNNRNLTIRLIRIMAGVLLAGGVSVFFDLFGTATKMGWTDGGLNRIIGAALMMVAVVDAVLVPRILEKSTGQDKL